MVYYQPGFLGEDVTTGFVSRFTFLHVPTVVSESDDGDKVCVEVAAGITFLNK